MIFLKIYKNFFHYLSDFRWTACLCALLLIPIAMALFFLSSRFEELKRWELRIAELDAESIKGQAQKKNFRKFLKQFQDADHFYLDKEVESLLFLRPEIDILEHLLEHPAFSQSEAIQKRLHFLKEEGNRLLFAEEARRTSARFYEVEERLSNSVEIGKEDLKRILSRIEGTCAVDPPQSKAPQLTIKEFDLQRKPLSAKGEVYFLNLALIKREIKQ